MKRLLACLILLVIACLFTYDVATFPDIHTDYTSACQSSPESTRFAAANTKVVVACAEGTIKIKCNVNTEFCALVESGAPTLSHLKLVKTSFLEDYLLLSAVVDGKEVSYVSAVESAATRANQVLWIYATVIWLTLFLNVLIWRRRQKNKG